jgi:hypothetical protein
MTEIKAQEVDLVVSISDLKKIAEKRFSSTELVPLLITKITVKIT